MKTWQVLTIIFLFSSLPFLGLTIHLTDAQGEPIFSRGGLAEANASIVIYPSVAQFQLRLMYFGDSVSLLSDEILFPNNFEILSTNSSISSVHITPILTEKNNSQSVILNFSRPLFSGENLELILKGRFVFSDTSQLIEEEVWWNYTRAIGFQTVKFLVFDGINIHETIPSASITKVEGRFLAMVWNDIVPSGFHVRFSASVTEEARNELFLSSTKLMATVGSIDSILSLQIGNVGLTSVAVRLETPKFVMLESDEFVIEPFTLQLVKLNLHIENEGKHEGVILVWTNRTDVPLTIKVIVFAENLPDGTNWILIILSSILFLSIIGFGIYYSQKKMTVNIEKTTKMSLDLRNLEERQVAIMEFIQQNPGCSQQAIANSLGISKATASRELMKLENMGYIKKAKDGMSHRIYLNL